MRDGQGMPVGDAQPGFGGEGEGIHGRLPAGHRLWRLANCLITPHTSCPAELAAPLLLRRIRDNVVRLNTALEDGAGLGRVGRTGDQREGHGGS